MKRLFLLVGPSGSGKSTMSYEFVQQWFTRINQDDMGKQGHLDAFNEALDKGQRDRYLLPAKKKGYITEIIVLHESYDTCLSRCLERKDHPTIKDEKDASKALNMFFSKYERVQDDEADKVHRKWPEGDKIKAIWVDMDNTLSNATHREHYLQGEKKNWKEFFNAMNEDPVNEWCKAIVNSMYNSYFKILICSARPDDYRKQTEEWLGSNSILYDRLIMRRRGDFRKDSIVKEIMFEFEIKTQYNLLFSIDDRRQVIDQIRSHGVIVLDCAGEKGHF